jgi:hypothetical protein
VIDGTLAPGDAGWQLVEDLVGLLARRSGAPWVVDGRAAARLGVGHDRRGAYGHHGTAGSTSGRSSTTPRPPCARG